MNKTPYSCVTGFGPAAMIRTTTGDIPFEWLESGDVVITRDRGPQPVLWIARSRGMGPDGLRLPPPVELRPSAGPTDRDIREKLRISPNTHVLLEGPSVQELFGVDEAMARMGDLSRRGGARENEQALNRVYHHVVTAGHDLIQTAGIWVETTCPKTAQLLSPTRQVYEASSVFHDGTGAPRRCLTWDEAKLIRGTVPESLTVLSLLAA